MSYTERTEPRRPGALAGRIVVAADFDRTPDDLIDAFEESASEADDVEIRDA